MKKFLSILLILAMATTLLASCSGTGSENNETATQGEEISAKVEETESTVKGTETVTETVPAVQATETTEETESVIDESETATEIESEAEESETTEDFESEAEESETTEEVESETTEDVESEAEESETIEDVESEAEESEEIESDVEESETEDIVLSYTVTEDEWYRALNLLLNENYVHTGITKYNEMETLSITEKNGNNIRTTSSMGAYSFEQYWVVDGDSYRMHEKLDPEVTSATYWNSQFEYDEMFRYSEFTYDEEKKAYTADESLYQMTEIEIYKFSDVSFYFENGKFVKATYTLTVDMDGFEMVNLVVETISYGNAPKIVLPELN